MKRNDSFETETICGTELQNGEKLLKETSIMDMDNTLKREQMLDLQVPSFICGDEVQDADNLF
jgi:hypothetical protein